jgi:hypothetical protein
VEIVAVVVDSAAEEESNLNFKPIHKRRLPSGAVFIWTS